MKTNFFIFHAFGFLYTYKLKCPFSTKIGKCCVYDADCVSDSNMSCCDFGLYKACCHNDDDNGNAYYPHPYLNRPIKVLSGFYGNNSLKSF